MGSELSGPVLRCRRRAEGVFLVCFVVLVCGAEGEKSGTGATRVCLASRNGSRDMFLYQALPKLFVIHLVGGLALDLGQDHCHNEQDITRPA